MSYLFAFSYCSWGSQGKNTEVVFHFLLQLTAFCQTSPPWPIRLGWPHMVCLSFTELDKALVRVIRLASCLWLWFQSVCPLMPSLRAYHLSWISLTLDVGYLFRAAPAKCRCCSLPLMWGSSSRPLLLTLCYYFSSVHFSRSVMSNSLWPHVLKQASHPCLLANLRDFSNGYNGYIQQMLAIWSLVPLPFLNTACTSRIPWFTYCGSLAWRILSITLLACEMSEIVWSFEHSLSLPFFGVGMKTDLFQS